MYFDILILQSIKMLKNLEKFLALAQDFATQKKIESEVLLNSRLAPDQFNLIRQVQIACDTVKLGVSRLTGKEAPANSDNEKTIGELQIRIAQTVHYLEGFTLDDLKDAATRKVTTPRWENKYLIGHDYVIHHVIPNLYFHTATAYAILRHNGVNLGKKDYLGEMPFKH